MLAYMPGREAAAIVATMTAAVADVASGEVTQAVRDATTPAGTIAQGDWLGVVSGEVIAVAADCVTACADVVDRIIGEESELVTVIIGAGADEETTATVLAGIESSHPDVDVSVVPGAQPLYPYMFGAE
jgi:dihydroxyacetone kinase-like predicted kinase